MTFIKLGSRYVNIEMITDVYLDEDRPASPERHAEVYLAAPMGERLVSNKPLDVSTRHIHVSGADAERLIRLLDEHSTSS